MNSAARRAPRLGRDDWIAAGQAVLCEAGIAGLRLSALTRRLRVSTGSFYHHFEDMEAYLGALARHFSRGDVKRILERAANGASAPLSRIRRLAAISLNSTIFQLDRAMRIWATSDRRAMASVKASEKLVLAYLTDAFTELGFSPADAALRAHLLLSANVALIGAFRLEGNRALFDQSLDFLTRDAPALAGTVGLRTVGVDGAAIGAEAAHDPERAGPIDKLGPGSKRSGKPRQAPALAGAARRRRRATRRPSA